MPAGGGYVYECTEVPIEDVSRYGMRALNFLARLGIDVFEAL
jgi:hypothetical protein